MRFLQDLILWRSEFCLKSQDYLFVQEKTCFERNIKKNIKHVVSSTSVIYSVDIISQLYNSSIFQMLRLDWLGEPTSTAQVLSTPSGEWNGLQWSNEYLKTESVRFHFFNCWFCCYITVSLHSLTEKPAESSQKHMAEQRQRVVTELINTERDYCSDLELCVKHFLFELQTTQVSFCY